MSDHWNPTNQFYDDLDNLQLLASSLNKKIKRQEKIANTNRRNNYLLFAIVLFLAMTQAFLLHQHEINSRKDTPEMLDDSVLLPGDEYDNFEFLCRDIDSQSE